ncbi:MAG: RNase adapter RapZ [Oscillospiraceae bacterium]|mgnify:CR=1 FL=1|nr:RNase adapter RapZ [Oscillospiraceae bacterium]MCI9394302.1 RNase adapter RapZ [Oscillospiraceae bacterium]MCI9579764.1 RNase adapter RapZ [Oscillospiraceae bacterium]
MDFIIVTGMSGAGKSKAASFLEDMGFFCVDNLPVPLIPKFAELVMAGTGEYDRVALVTDIRSGGNVEGLAAALDALNAAHCAHRIFFMDASDQTIIKRYKETRRSHPLAEERDTLEGAIALERQMLTPLRERADTVVDTSNLSTSKLKGELRRLAGQGRGDVPMEVQVSSFGFKYGLPMEADLVFDVRFLPNPFYVPELRPLTGLDSGVRDYVFSGGQGEDFLHRLEEFVTYLLPRYVDEGKTSLVISVGCTGGHHRSVAIAHALAQRLREKSWQVSEQHRDMGRS